MRHVALRFFLALVITFLGLRAWDLIAVRFGRLPENGRILKPWQTVKDFTGFYIGAKKLGASDLYDIPTNLAMQREITGATNPGIIFVRPPFWALLIRPIAELPYRTALRSWKAICVAGLIMVALIDPHPWRAAVALLCSYPLHVALSIYQDVPLILMWIALALWAWRSDRRFLAGALLAMCLPKFHLLVFLPLLLFQRRYRPALAGFVAVAAVLTAINFLVQPHWIALYARALMMPNENMNGRPGLMPNFAAVFAWTGHAGIAFVLSFFAMAFLAWRVSRIYAFEIAMPLAILAAMLGSWHANDSDTVLAIPVCLALYEARPKLRLFPIVLLSPATTLLLVRGPAYIGAAMFVIPFTLLVIYLAWARKPSYVMSADHRVLVMQRA